MCEFADGSVLEFCIPLFISKTETQLSDSDNWVSALLITVY